MSRLLPTSPRQWLVPLCTAFLMTACGGGDSASSGSSDPDSRLSISASMLPGDDEDAHRFLTQATFGATPSEVARVRKIGYDNWIDEQLALPLQSSHLSMAEASARHRGHTTVDAYDVINTWWTHAVHDPAQLRQRLAFALSEIFVVSTVSVGNGRTVASYLDMLTEGSNQTYRQLLESVALHPAMGQYLSHLTNRKEDPTSGRVPDENFGREVMQLFSIGLYQLDSQGQQVKVGNKPVETYNADDVKGMAKVFTGWSWFSPQAILATGIETWRCFWRVNPCKEDSQDVTAMSPYASEHSTSARTVLGTAISAQSAPNPKADLSDALDRLAQHPNTAPFISRQLIQRLVTSNPSPQYVGDVAAVFRSSGGNFKAVVKAILLHAEARHPETVLTDLSTYGKLREPVIRLAHLLRTLPHTSKAYTDSQAAGTLPFLMTTDTDSSSSALGQSPMRSPSVFNFFRPGYSPPQTRMGNAKLVAPEMQITNETSVVAYANFVSAILRDGWGQWRSESNQLDIQFDTSAFNTQVSSGSSLIDAVAQTLLGAPLPADTRALAATALDAMPASTDGQKKQRIRAAILLTAVSPGFTVQQ